nr:SDR family oxidoreductase [Streptomyces sp. DSM 41633]
AFDDVGERWGEINALINTVGPGAAGNFEELTDDQWQEAFDAGLMGMVRCVRTALPLLRNAEWARIVNFSAHSTQRQSTRLPAYSAATAAVNSVSKNLSLLLAKDEIMVNVVSPGSISSESLRGWAGTVGVDGDDPYALMAAIDEHFGHPAHLPRAGLPSEIGPVAAFLASKRNSYMSGANINVDGGSDYICAWRSTIWRRQPKRGTGRAVHCAESVTHSIPRSAEPTATTSTGMPTGTWCATAPAISVTRCFGVPAVWPSSGR